MARNLSPSTRLSELRQLGPLPVAVAQNRLVRSVQQSMRVEGYPVSENDVRSSAALILKTDAK